MNLANVFNDAADMIEENGWWNGTRNTDPNYVGGPRAKCLWTAVTHSLLGRNHMSLGETLDAEMALRRELGADSLAQVFDINDSHDPATGKEWAVGVLRGVADTFNEVDAVMPEESVTEKVENVSWFRRIFRRNR